MPGPKKVKGGPSKTLEARGCTALARFLAFLAAGEYGAAPPRGAPLLPASWPSWPPASTGREGARTARCRRPPPRGSPHLPASWPSWPPASTGRPPFPGVHRPCPLLGLLGRRRVWGEKARVARRSCGYSPLLAGGQVSQEAAERGPSSTTACATRAYLLLTCPRASKPTSSSQGGPPSDKSVATCTYMPHRWMDAASHQKRQWSARADIRSYLRSACSREHARILGFDGLQHAGRE